MNELPILMSAPMVRANLREVDPKTQTRRVLKPQPLGGAPYLLRHLVATGHYRWATDEPDEEQVWNCPYGKPGDRLLLSSEIPGVGRAYCAGSDGVIYSRARGNWRPLKAHLNDNGYPCVTVMLAGLKTTRAVHSLVCAAFYGPPQFDGAQVRHLNGDPQCNTPDNLCWGTQAENWLDRRAHGNGLDGEKHHAAKLTDDERAHLRWAVERGLCSQHHAARVLGMTQGAIWQVMQGAELRVADQPDAGLRVPHITLQVTDVRVKRLQDISEADAIAEGIEQRVNAGQDSARWRVYGTVDTYTSDPVISYQSLWEQINGAGSWSANPWIWAITYRRVLAVHSG